MAKFDAAEEIDELEYDFSKYSTSPAAVGSIPEPSAKQISAFLSTIAQMIREELDGNGDTSLDADNPAELLAALDKMTEAQFTKQSKTMCAAIAKLCSNMPSEAVLTKLPWRLQQSFAGWVQGHFFPEASRAATNASVAAQTNGTSTTSPENTSATA